MERFFLTYHLKSSTRENTLIAEDNESLRLRFKIKVKQLNLNFIDYLTDVALVIN